MPGLPRSFPELISTPIRETNNPDIQLLYMSAVHPLPRLLLELVFPGQIAQSALCTTVNGYYTAL